MVPSDHPGPAHSGLLGPGAGGAIEAAARPLESELNPTTIVIAEDFGVVRRGVRLLLEAEKDLRVVGEATDGPSAVEAVLRLRPAVLVLGLALPRLGGLEVVRRVREQRPQTRAVVLSRQGDLSLVHEAMQAGASAFVFKEASAASLVHAVREAARGRRYLSPPISERALAKYARAAGRGSRDPYETLTPREREILQLVVEGHSSPTIGWRLGISHRTVEAHRASLMRKLGLSTLAGLLRFALRRGLIPPEEPPAGGARKAGVP
jgi:two-component system response regulator NreC